MAVGYVTDAEGRTRAGRVTPRPLCAERTSVDEAALDDLERGAGGGERWVCEPSAPALA